MSADLDPQRGISVGERWEKTLHEAAGSYDAVLFLTSTDWLASEWCFAKRASILSSVEPKFGMTLDRDLEQDP